mmetsp:Transcript_12512/g.29015  ORF Transcript_12512/g.29015 Transcript_12512/m.29015 type:complete len:261 (-) Transcript_12512:760-1542(-)
METCLASDFFSANPLAMASDAASANAGTMISSPGSGSSFTSPNPEATSPPSLLATNPVLVISTATAPRRTSSISSFFLPRQKGTGGTVIQRICIILLSGSRTAPTSTFLASSVSISIVFKSLGNHLLVSQFANFPVSGTFVKDVVKSTLLSSPGTGGSAARSNSSFQMSMVISLDPVKEVMEMSCNAGSFPSATRAAASPIVSRDVRAVLPVMAYPIEERDGSTRTPSIWNSSLITGIFFGPPLKMAKESDVSGSPKSLP